MKNNKTSTSGKTTLLVTHLNKSVSKLTWQRTGISFRDIGRRGGRPYHIGRVHNRLECLQIGNSIVSDGTFGQLSLLST